MWIDILYILIGFVLLVKGGDFLIDGAVAIAQRAKLSAMVIGITVVGFGTSMPELLVSTQAAWVGSSGLAIGNVAGSNIANIALILGVTAMICPLPSQRTMMRIDIPFMLFAMVLFVRLYLIQCLSQGRLSELEYAGVVQGRSVLLCGEQVGAQVGILLFFRGVRGGVEGLKGRGPLLFFRSGTGGR